MKLTPAAAVAHAIARDAEDDVDIGRAHGSKVEARAHYRTDRLVLLAGIALCDSLSHARAVRPCDGCRTAVRELLQQETRR